ncbi:MAG: hypothetical protein IJB96_04010, partial [Lachnospira sp.]|nr:hypothetical protein [Lachnospira sp.]
DVNKFPETVKMYYSFINKYSFADKESVEIAKSALEEVMKDPEKANKSNATVSVYSNIPGGDGAVSISTWGRVSVNKESVVNGSEIINAMYPKLIESLSKDQNIDVTDSKKALARIGLSVRKGEYNVQETVYYVQLDDLGFKVEDCIIEEERND